MRPTAGFLLAVALLSGGSAAEAQWGELRMRFTYDGTPPQQPLLEINKDQALCVPFKLRDRELDVDPKSKGIANVVVWLDEKKSGRMPNVHPKAAARAKLPVTLTNVNCSFEPRIVTMQAGGTLLVGNQDPVAHAAAVFFRKNTPINVALVPKGKETKTVDKAESLPSPVSCPIHAWMKGFVVVREHPYAAVSGKDGTLVLPDLPAGQWTFRVWHEVPGYVSDVSVGGEATRWTRGYLTVDVPADGKLDLGDVVVDADEFED